jgi:hypothetical protein
MDVDSQWIVAYPNNGGDGDKFAGDACLVDEPADALKFGDKREAELHGHDHPAIDDKHHLAEVIRIGTPRGPRIYWNPQPACTELMYGEVR